MHKELRLTPVTQKLGVVVHANAHDVKVRGLEAEKCSHFMLTFHLSPEMLRSGVQNHPWLYS